jgi:hypothetical protein
MALMALAVTTLMGTPAALAEEVDVSGSVGCAATTSSVTAPAVNLGTLEKGILHFADMSPVITKGKNADCTDKNAFLSPRFDSDKFTGLAERGSVGMSIGSFNTETQTIPLFINVPIVIANGDFGATAILTLSAD